MDITCNGSYFAVKLENLEAKLLLDILEQYRAKNGQDLYIRILKGELLEPLQRHAGQAFRFSIHLQDAAAFNHIFSQNLTLNEEQTTIKTDLTSMIQRYITSFRPR